MFNNIFYALPNLDEEVPTDGLSPWDEFLMHNAVNVSKDVEAYTWSSCKPASPFLVVEITT